MTESTNPANHAGHRIYVVSLDELHVPVRYKPHRFVGKYGEGDIADSKITSVYCADCRIDLNFEHVSFEIY